MKKTDCLLKGLCHIDKSNLVSSKRKTLRQRKHQRRRRSRHKYVGQHRRARIISTSPSSTSSSPTATTTTVQSQPPKLLHIQRNLPRSNNIHSKSARAHSRHHLGGLLRRSVDFEPHQVRPKRRRPLVHHSRLLHARNSNRELEPHVPRQGRARHLVVKEPRVNPIELVDSGYPRTWHSTAHRFLDSIQLSQRLCDWLQTRHADLSVLCEFELSRHSKVFLRSSCHSKVLIFLLNAFIIYCIYVSVFFY